MAAFPKKYCSASNSGLFDKWGIKNIRIPLQLSGSAPEHHTVAVTNMHVTQPQYVPQTMAFFVEQLGNLSCATQTAITALLNNLRESFQARAATLELAFSYFSEKESPITKTKSLMAYPARLTCCCSETTDVVTSVDIPVSTLCPCSQATSNYGAHSQRCTISISARLSSFPGLDRLIHLAEQSASSEIFPLLQRPDEKAVTEKLYDTPMSAGDVAEKLTARLNDAADISWYSLEILNQESIHQYDTVVAISGPAQTA